MTQNAAVLLAALLFVCNSAVKAAKVDDFKQAKEAVEHARAREEGWGCKTIPYGDLQEICTSQRSDLHEWCDQAASCDGVPTRELKSKLVNEQQNESRLKDQRHDLDEKRIHSSDDNEKSKLADEIKELDQKIEDSGKNIKDFEKDLNDRKDLVEKAIPIIEKCLDYRKAIQNVFSTALDKMRNEDESDLKEYAEEILKYYEEEKQGHGLAITAKERAREICKDNVP